MIDLEIAIDYVCATPRTASAGIENDPAQIPGVDAVSVWRTTIERGGVFLQRVHVELIGIAHG